MRKIVVVFLLFPVFVFSQLEKYPIYKECNDQSSLVLKNCFYTQTNVLFYKEFKLPNQLLKENYNKSIKVVFEVTKKGDFKVIQVTPRIKELKKEVVRVFSHFPKITSATFNNTPKEMSFVLPVILQTIHPTFKECETKDLSKSKNCFYKSTNNAFFKEFKTPKKLKRKKFKGKINIVFEVTTLGNFKLISVETKYQELKVEIERVFTKLPKIKPAINQGVPVDMRFDFPISFPIIFSVKK